MCSLNFHPLTPTHPPLSSVHHLSINQVGLYLEPAALFSQLHTSVAELSLVPH